MHIYIYIYTEIYPKPTVYMTKRLGDPPRNPHGSPRDDNEPPRNLPGAHSHPQDFQGQFR